MMATPLQATNFGDTMQLVRGHTPPKTPYRNLSLLGAKVYIWHRKIAGFKVRSCPWFYQRRFRESVARRIIKRQFAFKRRYRTLSAYKIDRLRMSHLYYTTLKRRTP